MHAFFVCIYAYINCMCIYKGINLCVYNKKNICGSKRNVDEGIYMYEYIYVYINVFLIRM
jgi:hypothetical protein